MFNHGHHCSIWGLLIKLVEKNKKKIKRKEKKNLKIRGIKKNKYQILLCISHADKQQSSK